MIIVSEFGNIFKFFKSKHKSLENLSNIRSLLHGNDSQLIFFIDPDEESLRVVMENASIVWPVSVDTACLEEAVTLFEKEVILNQLLLLCW